ncbi:Metallophos domain-containing protein [Planctomycetales bacterium 10988]|nr:Metallophos domain-containing protein [Planctomycetales bacterium 10988]
MASVETSDLVRDAANDIFAAIEATLLTAGREKNVVRLTPELGEDVMITADLHGHWDNFHHLLEVADLDNHPRRHLIMHEVCHGGPSYEGKPSADRSHEMLLEVARLKRRYPDRFHFIISNHELSEMTEYPISKDGRMVTLAFRLGIGELFGQEMEHMHQVYSAFIGCSPLGVWLPGGIFVCHSAPADVDTEGFDASVMDRNLTQRDLNSKGAVFRMVWGRDYRQENADAFADAIRAKVLIHGHTPCEEGYNVPNTRQIILDCCHTPASYVILPLDQELDQQDIIGRIQVFGE